MKLTIGTYTRIFTWMPVRFLERSSDGDAYEMKTAFLKHVWVVASRANGGGASLIYKSDDVYAREWRESVMAKVQTDFSVEELDAYFRKVGISHTTHQISEATKALSEYVAKHGA